LTLGLFLAVNFAWPQIYPGQPHPADLRSLQKFEKVE
jgi:hypothetical protein